MSKICKFCWEPIPDDTDTCPTCGKKISEIMDKSSYGTLNFKLKNKENPNILNKPEIPKGELSSDQLKNLELQNKKLSQKKNRRKNPILIFAVAVILIIVLVGFYAYANGSGKKKTQKNQINKFLGVLANQEKQKQEDTRFFDPNSKIEYNYDPYFDNKYSNHGGNKYENLSDGNNQLQW